MLILKSNFIIIVRSVIIDLSAFFVGSSNVVTGETKSFFSVARSVSIYELKHLLTFRTWISPESFQKIQFLSHRKHCICKGRDDLGKRRIRWY